MTSSSSGLTMLTSGVSQYLHPDYLQPLPTTLDAKKSPLALLAQTCSAIGKDTSPSKPIIPPLEKKDMDKSDKCQDSESSSKRPSSHGHKESGRDSGRDSKPGFRTFPPKEIPPLVPISMGEKPRTSSSEPKASSSPSGHMNSISSSSSSRPVSASGQGSNGQRSSSRSSNGKESDHHQHSSHHHHRNRDSPASSGSSSHPVSSSPSYSKPMSSHSTSVMQSSSLSSAVKPSVSHPSMLGGLPSAAHLSGYPSHLALMAHGLDPTNPSYHALAAHSSLSSFSAAAAAAQSSALKAAAAAGAPSALSPFVTYARVRTPSGATTLVPVCRDPYCTNCQLTLQNSHLSSTCNAPGCSQCAHEKSLTSLSTLGLPGAGASSMLLSPLSSASSLSSSMSALSSIHALYPHTALAAAHQGLQANVCNWVSGNDYCGKRFTSSEELLQHLRTHTSSMDVSTLAASYAGLGLPSLAAYPHLSAPLSPNSLRRSYPTSLSPVSSLLSANRYHPYKSPLSAVGATPPSAQSFPVGPYYSPYTLYGQRLGAAVVP
ncbi:zinc finger protein Noc-like [Physella acuta]|uniref:zinc finger protein Noc-like n=1 Tax=Physella acuta TaxID=109671 RepID=UPI0027DB91B6|nr:zinc finger protein Noc-like [Physella acuta]